MKNLLVTALLFHVSQSIVYYVVPDDKYNSNYSTTRTFTLQHYLNNTDQYFKSQTELRFKQGHHSLLEEWILQDVSNFIINGNNSTLSCLKSSIGIAVINATNITVKGLHIRQCSKKWNYTINNQTYNYYKSPVVKKSSLFIYHSADVVISNISVTINDSVTSGIIGVNVFPRNLSKSSFTNITVVALCENNINSSVSGINLYYNDGIKNFATLKAIVTIQQYNYKTCGFCNKSFALRFIMMHKEYNVKIQVEDTNFSDLLNSRALLYYGEACRNAYKQTSLTFYNCKVNNNSGNETIDMFIIRIYNFDYSFDTDISIVKNKSKDLCSKLGNSITFRNCDFINNTMINSLIKMVLKHNEQLSVFVVIKNSNICYNNGLQLITTDSELKLLKALSHTIIISATKILSNSCAAKNRISLISLSSGIIKFEDSVIGNNTSFENIVKLHSSLLQFEGFTNFSGNYARYILHGTEGSYFVHTEFSTVQINDNLVYTLITSSDTYTKTSQQICMHQFITKSNNNLDKKIKSDMILNFTVVQGSKNIYTIPEYRISKIMKLDLVLVFCVADNGCYVAPWYLMYVKMSYVVI